MMSSSLPPCQSNRSQKLDTPREPEQLDPDLAYLLTNALPAHISYVDAQQRYRFVNKRYEEWFQRPATEIVGRHIQEIMEPSVYQGACSYIEAALSGKKVTYESFVPTKDGEKRYLHVNYVPHISEAGEVLGFFVLVQDLTDRKQAEMALEQQTKREQLVAAIAQRIRQSLNLKEILNTTVVEVRQFLQADRVFVIRFQPDRSGVVVVESVDAGLPSIVGSKIVCPDADTNFQFYEQGQIQAVEDIHTAGFNQPYIDFLARFQVRAKLGVPIQQGEQLWGLLIAHHCSQPRQWQQFEIDLLQQLATQVAIAIQQSELYQQVQRLNTELEYQVQERTAQLQQALHFEATLKRITDKVRDSLDESQILQTALQELCSGLKVCCCSTALYDTSQTDFTIRYEYTTSSAASRGQACQPAEFPEIYNQLRQGEYFQFCERVSHLAHDRVAILVCPIADDQKVLGDLWLFKQKFGAFDELEIRLVQQVANQCAIAIRQARLYQAVQIQVQELQKLSQLKDDFLSTVSHELRTPVTNIKMATQMLTVAFNQDQGLVQPNRVHRYLQILQDECAREISLINDLLDLQRLEVGEQTLALETIRLQPWLLQVVEPFQERVRDRQQMLRLDIPTTLPPLVSDRASLERILVELLNNACKYTPAGGQIVLRVEAKPGAIQLQAINSGTEIPTSELARIFDKFYRIPSHDPWKQGGTGLGLALVQKLTEYLGGTIQVESASNQTCFTVKLPSTSLT